MTTTCWTPRATAPATTVTPIHHTAESRARGVKLAAYLAARRRGLPTATCIAIRDRAVQRYRAGTDSAAMSVAHANAEAQRLATRQPGDAA